MASSQPTGLAQSDDPWIIARDQYILDLNEEEKKLFTHATLENLLFESTNVQDTQEQKSSSRAFMQRLKPFLSAVEDFGSALDVYSSTYSLALGPIWGTLRVVLHLAKKFNKIFDRIVDVFERIGYVLPRFRDYQRIFGKHPRIIKALSAAYLDIITLCAEIKAFIRSIEKARIRSFTKLFSPLDHHLSEAVGRFRQHREDVEMEAEACHMIESAKHYELELRDRELAASERKSQLRKHLLHLLSPIDSAGKQRKLLKVRQEGTGNWLSHNDDYNAWKNSTQSSVLSIFGIPGSGKTILASSIIDILQEGISERVVVIHHYCDYKDTRSLNPIIVAGSLISGLLKSLEITDDISNLITYAYQNGEHSPDGQDIRQILDSVLELRLDHVIYVVLDGVDEVQEQDRKQLLDFMNHFMGCKHSLIKLVVTSRADISGAICQPRTAIHRLPITQRIISRDIDIFVRYAVRSLISSQELLIREVSLEHEIIAKLAVGAKGMFLWVTFQLRSLCDCDSDSEIHKTLDNLPRDLTETYERLLSRIQNPQRQVLVRKMLQWITCARRLLHIDELLEAVAFNIDDDHWDLAKIPVDPTRLIRASGNLIVVDDEDRTVQLAHYTVQQYLLTTALETGFSFRFTREEAEQYLGETCVVYLSFNDFETQITKYTNRTKAHMAIIEKALLHSDSITTGGNGGFVESTVVALSNLLRSSSPYKPSNVDYSRHIPQSKQGFQSKYELLGYAVVEWLSHTAKLSSGCPRGEILLFPETEAEILRSVIWRRFQNLVFKKQLLFNLKPWSQSKVKSPNLPYFHMVCWAVRNRHVALLNSLGESTPHPVEEYFRQTVKWFGSKNRDFLNFDHNQKIVDMSNILLPDQVQMEENPDACALFYYIYEACTLGVSEIIELYVFELDPLNPGGVNMRSRDLQLVSEYLMIEAAANGREEVCKILLPYCHFKAYTMNQGRPCGALKRAAFQGHTAVVSLLQSSPAALTSAMDKSLNEPRVPGQWRYYEAKMVIDAARGGDLNIVTTLLSVCNLEIITSYDDEVELAELSDIIVGERALMQAIDGGYKDVVAHLLDRGVSINNPLPWRIFDLDQDASRRSSLEIPRMVEMGCFALHIAIAHDDTAMTKFLLEADADPDLCVYYFQQERYVNRKWKSPLAHAASLGNLLIVEDLITHGAHVESQYLTTTALASLSFRYTTPLISACHAGHLDIVERLIEAGANISNYDFAGCTPLSAAAAGDHLACAQLLLSHGASTHLVEHDSVSLVSPMIEAIRCGSKKMLRLLLEEGMDLNAKTQRKNPLIVALQEGDVEIVEMLVKRGADVDGDEEARRTIGWPASPLCRAIRANQPEIVDLLLREGADISAAVSWEGHMSPVGTALAHAHHDAAKIVLRRGGILPWKAPDNSEGRDFIGFKLERVPVRLPSAENLGGSDVLPREGLENSGGEEVDSGDAVSVDGDDDGIGVDGDGSESDEDKAAQLITVSTTLSNRDPASAQEDTDDTTETHPTHQHVLIAEDLYDSTDSEHDTPHNVDEQGIPNAGFYRAPS